MRADEKTKHSLVVFGAGGHGKVVAEVLRASGESAVGFVDERRAAGDRVAGLPVLGNLDWLKSHPCRVALGIGDNALRAIAADAVRDAGCSLVIAVHPSAVVAPSASIDEGTVVMPCVVVNPDARVGRAVILNTGCVVEHDCVVEDFAHLSPRVAIAGGCKVGTLVHLGIGVTMLPSRSVGARSVVGGGATVVHDLPADVVAIGTPARVRAENR